MVDAPPSPCPPFPPSPPALSVAAWCSSCQILAEASPYDKVWGIGLSADDPRALVQRKWQGENKLGEALMDVRRQLKEDMYDADVAGDADGAGEGGDTSDDYDMGSFDENDTIGKHRL